MSVTEFNKEQMKEQLLKRIFEVTRSDDLMNIVKTKNEIFVVTMHEPPAKKQIQRWTITITKGY